MVQVHNKSTTEARVNKFNSYYMVNILHTGGKPPAIWVWGIRPYITYTDLLQGLPSSMCQADHPAAGTVQCHAFHAGYVSLTVTNPTERRRKQDVKDNSLILASEGLVIDSVYKPQKVTASIWIMLSCSSSE